MGANIRTPKTSRPKITAVVGTGGEVVRLAKPRPRKGATQTNKNSTMKKSKTQKAETKKPVPQLVEWFDDHFYKVTIPKEQFIDVPQHVLPNITTKLEGEQVSIWIPSVTTKLGIAPKPFLNKWRGDVGNWEANRRMREGQEKGSNIHSAWQIITGGGLVIYNNSRRPTYSAKDISKLQKKHKEGFFILHDQQEMFELWKLQQWFEVVQPKVIYSEKIIYSLLTMDAGTVDGLYYIKEGVYQVNGKEPLRLKAGYYVIDVKTGAMIDRNADAQTATYAEILNRCYGYEIEGTLVIHTNSKTRTGIQGLSTHFRNKEEMQTDYEYYQKMSAAWLVSELSSEKPTVFDFPSSIQLFKKEKVKRVKQKKEKAKAHNENQPMLPLQEMITNVLNIDETKAEPKQ